MTWREGKNRPNASRNDVAFWPPSGFREIAILQPSGSQADMPAGENFLPPAVAKVGAPLCSEILSPPPMELQPPLTPQRCGLNSDSQRDGNSKRFTPCQRHRNHKHGDEASDGDNGRHAVLMNPNDRLLIVRQVNGKCSTP
jgi:hypothetical protein